MPLLITIRKRSGRKAFSSLLEPLKFDRKKRKVLHNCQFYATLAQGRPKTLPIIEIDLA